MRGGHLLGFLIFIYFGELPLSYLIEGILGKNDTGEVDGEVQYRKKTQSVWDENWKQPLTLTPKCWKELNYPPVGEWIKKRMYSYNGLLFSNIKE